MEPGHLISFVLYISAILMFQRKSIVTSRVGVGGSAKYEALDKRWEGTPGLRSKALALKYEPSSEPGLYFLCLAQGTFGWFQPESPQRNDHLYTNTHTCTPTHSEPLQKQKQKNNPAFFDKPATCRL